MAMNPAERHFSADADAAIAALRRSRRVPYGGGLHSSSCTVPLPGVAGAELLDELRTLLGWPLDGEVPLALDDATEGVRRLLTLLYPRLPASDDGYWSEADCRLIARQVLASAGRSAAAADAPGRLPWRPVPEWPNLPPTHPPCWLEAAQTLGYAAARRLLNALGLESRFGDAPGCRLHWYDSGAGGGGASAPPLLLIHGMFTTGASLAPLALLLRSSRRVLVVDLPGMDYSYSTSRPARYGRARPCSLEGSIDAVAWLVSRLAPSGSGLQVDLLGHSFGANVALELARQEGAEGAVRHVHLLTPGGASAARLSGVPSARASAAEARTARLLRQLAAPLLRAAARFAECSSCVPTGHSKTRTRLCSPHHTGVLTMPPEPAPVPCADGFSVLVRAPANANAHGRPECTDACTVLISECSVPLSAGSSDRPCSGSLSPRTQSTSGRASRTSASSAVATPPRR